MQWQPMAAYAGRRQLNDQGAPVTVLISFNTATAQGYLYHTNNHDISTSQLVVARFVNMPIPKCLLAAAYLHTPSVIHQDEMKRKSWKSDTESTEPTTLNDLARGVRETSAG